MGSTIAYERLGSFAVEYHPSASPDPDEFAAFLALHQTHLLEAPRLPVLVWTDGGHPNATQRRLLSEAILSANANPRVVVMTRSPIIKGVLGALAWLGISDVTPMTPDEFERAVIHLGLSAEESRLARKRLDALRATVSARQRPAG